MAEKKRSDLPFSDFMDVSKLFKNIDLPGFDAEALLDNQRRNIETLTNLNQIAAEGMTNVMRSQARFLVDAMNDMAAAAEELSQMRDTGDALTRQGERARRTFENTLTHMRELADMINQSNTAAFEEVRQRVEENLEELRNLTQAGSGGKSK